MNVTPLANRNTSPRATSYRRPGEPAVFGLPQFAWSAGTAVRPRPVDHESDLLRREHHIIPTHAEVAQVYRRRPASTAGVPVDPAPDGSGGGHQSPVRRGRKLRHDAVKRHRPG